MLTYAASLISWRHSYEGNREMSERDMEIGREILRQLGGSGRLKAMIGVKEMYAIENGLRFRFTALAKNKAKIVEIKLAGDDTYSVEYFRPRGFEASSVGFVKGIYCDQLKPTIEHALGLRLSF